MATKLKRCANPECEVIFVRLHERQKYCSKNCCTDAWKTMNRERVRHHQRQFYKRLMSTEEGYQNHRSKDLIWRKNNPEKVKKARERTSLKRAAKIKAADEILKLAREQGVYNG